MLFINPHPLSSLFMARSEEIHINYLSGYLLRLECLQPSPVRVEISDHLVPQLAGLFHSWTHRKSGPLIGINTLLSAHCTAARSNDSVRIDATLTILTGQQRIFECTTAVWPLTALFSI